MVKLKEGIFVPPQIRNIMIDEDLKNLMTNEKRLTSTCFKNVVNSFGGNRKQLDFRNSLEDVFNKIISSITNKIKMLQKPL